MKVVPAPRELFARLMAVGCGLAALQLAVGLLAGQALSPSAGWSVPVGGFLAALAIFGGLSLWVVVRALPLHRQLRRRAAGEEAPPSAAVLRELAVAHLRLGLASLLVPVSMTLFAVVDRGPLDPGGAVGPGLLTLSVTLAVISTALVVMRRILWSWPGRFQHHELGPVAGAPSVVVLAPGAAALAIGLGTTGACALGVAAGTSADRLIWSGTAAALAAAVGAGLLGRAIRKRQVSERRQVLDAVQAARLASTPPELPQVCSPGASALRAAALELHARLSVTVRLEDHRREGIEGIQRQKTRLMAAMGHDLRSPLNSILGFCDLLGLGVDGELSPGQRESLGIIAQSGRQLLGLLNDFLDSARFDAGRLALTPRYTPTVEVLTEAAHRGRDLLAFNRLTLEIELQPGLPPIYVDADRVVRAVVCVLRHVARALEEGTVRLVAREVRASDHRPAAVRLEVEDPAGRIRPEDREHIFEVFREVTAESGRRVGGLGLSLSLARKLLRAQGAELEYEHRSQGGALFLIVLPTAPADLGG